MKKTRIKSFIMAALIGVVFTAELPAQVPGIISYQGRLQVSGTNFTGTGQFKFALVTPNTSLARQATATAVVNSGFITDYFITDGGAGYTIPPTVTITDATGSGAVATASISGGAVTNITSNVAGSGYSSNPTVTISPPELVVDTLWSNDGSGTQGSEPGAAVNVAVSEGLFTVLLGDAGLPNMISVPPSVFENSDVRLRIWFNDGTQGFALLAPEQRLAVSGYAFHAAQAESALAADTALTASSALSVPWGGITGMPAGFADGVDNNTTYTAGTGLNLSGTTFSVANLGVGTAQLASNSVTSAKLADSAVLTAKLADDAVTAVKLANNAASLGKITGNTINKVGNNIGIRMDGQTLRAPLHVAMIAPSGLEYVFARTAIFESVGVVELALRTGSTNAEQTIYFERPIGQPGVLLRYSPGGLFEFLRYTITSTNGSSSSLRFVFDVINARLGVSRTPTSNNLEVNGNASKSTAGDWLANSDRRIKTDVRDIDNARDTLRKLRPVKFRYSQEWRERNPSIQDRDYYNFIAQEYREIFPHAVQGSGEYLEGDPEEILQIDTHDAQMVALKAVQELVQENAALQARLEKLEASLAVKLLGGVK